jgi:dephospho-CoA kinase
MYLIDYWLSSTNIIGLTGGIACGKSTLVAGLK